MAVTNLTGTTWRFNDTLVFYSGNFEYNINFTSDGGSYTKLIWKK